jgi:hypothetical protein
MDDLPGHTTRGMVLNRFLIWLAVGIGVAGIVLSIVLPVGGRIDCIEFAGCRTDPMGRVIIAVAGVTIAGVLAAVASARRDRWRRDARYS